MDKYLVPPKPSQENSKPIRRRRWKRSNIELNGRFEPKYRHEMSGLLMQSYSEIRAFPHLYHINRIMPCKTHNRLRDASARIYDRIPIKRHGISAMEFDNKGIYLASVTKSGCLTVHEFEALYYQSNKSLLSSEEDERKHLMHLSLNQNLDVVRWNPTCQDEVACASREHNEVLIFDIGLTSSDPVQILRTRNILNVHGSDIHRGLSDIAFTSIDDSRLFASDTCGVINVWDTRNSYLPCLALTTNPSTILNSIEFDAGNQLIFGAGRNGRIYIWDLRGGRESAAFQSHKEVCHPPLKSLKLSAMLEEIESLKAQSHIIPREIHSLDLDPSCPYQLAFHLDDGWSGVLDIYNFHVTHVHCPPPAWLNDPNAPSDLLYLRQPSWVPTYSIYAVGSSSDNGVHLLDFYPNPCSSSHVDHDETARSFSVENHRSRQNRFIPLSEGVTACAAHPLNGTIIVGTKTFSIFFNSIKQAILQKSSNNSSSPNLELQNLEDTENGNGTLSQVVQAKWCLKAS